MRLRITFAKGGDLRFIGNLDLHRLWERTARRAGLPLAYSQGFHPQPKISLASALPLGYTSRAELVELRLTDSVSLDKLTARLQAAVPAGLKVLQVDDVPDASPPLQRELVAAEYEVLLPASVESKLSTAVHDILRSMTIPRERRGKNYDLRPLIEDMRILPPQHETGRRAPNESASLWMRLAAREGATGRADAVLDAMGFAAEGTRIERVALVFSWGRVPDDSRRSST